MRELLGFVLLRDTFRLEALRGEKDLEGRPCVPVPFWTPSKI